MRLEENKPILPKEEIRRQYEEGEITSNQYKGMMMQRKNAIDYRMRVDDYMEYADKVVFEQEAIVAYIDEIIAEKMSRENQPDGSQGNKAYDPRKRESVNNKNRLDPQQKWATREEAKPLPKLQKARAWWKKYKKADEPTLNVSKRMQPILQWDVSKLRQIAKDKGFFTDVALMAVISETLNISIGGASTLLETGKLSWGQCIVIGAVLEMTPKEFCDVFLSGYFKDYGNGVFKAYVEDTSALLDAPYRALVKNKGEDNALD